MNAKLHIFADNLGSVESVMWMFIRINNIYIGVATFESLIEYASDYRHGSPNGKDFIANFEYKKTTNKTFFNLLKEIQSNIEPLELTAASFSSAGFWEFLGNINPLIQIRELIKDHHERKKDLSYRNSLDKKKMEIEIEHSQLQNLKKK